MGSTFTYGGKVVPAEFTDAFPQGVPVRIQVTPHGAHVLDGVGYHHLASAAGVLVDAVQVTAEDVAPAGVVYGDGGGRLRHRVPGVDDAQDGQQRRARVPQQCVGISPLVRVDVAAVGGLGRVALVISGETASLKLDVRLTRAARRRRSRVTSSPSLEVSPSWR